MEDSHKEGSPALAAKTMIAPPSPRTPRTPRTPRFQRPALAFNRTLSLDPSVHGSRRSSAASQAPPRVLLLEEPPDYEQSLSAPSVCLKMAQFALAVLCLGLVSDGYLLVVSQNVTAMHFPFIVFSSYTIITGVILFGYAMGMKMRELLMRIFGAMGALLFLISAIHTANRAAVFWEHWAGMYEEGPSEESLFDPDTVPRRRVCFVLQTALSFVAAALYAADVAHSYRRTLLLLQ